MRSFTLCLGLAFASLTSIGARAETPIPTRNPVGESTKFKRQPPQTWVALGLREAQRIARAMAIVRTAPYREHFAAISAALSHAEVVWKETGDYPACGAKTMAYVLGREPRIHLCAIVMRHPDFGVDALAQTLIHEGAHLAGFRRECDATKLEIAAVRFVTDGLAYRNAYMPGCGLR